ncbi:MAG: hypothetical protein ABW000_11355 [Actinoplanes sp.]|jgi:hypothetical protein
MTDNSDYGPGVEDVPTTYRPEKGNEEAGLSSTLAASTDPEQLVNGGPPPEGGGAITTTGGNAGPKTWREVRAQAPEADD